MCCLFVLFVSYIMDFNIFLFLWISSGFGFLDHRIHLRDLLLWLGLCQASLASVLHLLTSKNELLCQSLPCSTPPSNQPQWDLILSQKCEINEFLYNLLCSWDYIRQTEYIVQITMEGSAKIVNYQFRNP